MSLPLDDLHTNHLTHLDAAYAEALAACGFDAVMIYSGHARLHFADDQHSSFSAYGHFLHWVPLADLQHSWLLIRPGQRPLLQVHAPDDFWHLPARLPDEPWVDAFEIRYSDSGEPPQCDVSRLAVIGDVDPAQVDGWKTERWKAEGNPPRLTTALDELRMHKSDYEVACLVEANRLALLGHAASKRNFLLGGAELDAHLAYLAASRQRESALAYQNIVAINEHAGVLHYQHYDTVSPASRHSLLVDAGHRHRGYCADITRTWAGQDAPETFPTLLEAMNVLKERLIDAIAPGEDFVALHRRMHEALATMLADRDLVHCSPEAALDRGITRAFCPHGLGHSLGLQVHDVAGRRDPDGQPLPPPATDPALRLTRRLTPGMTITIEPGFYVIPMLLAPLREGPAASDLNWSAIERLAPCGGIRVEDNIVVTAEGHRNLTTIG